LDEIALLRRAYPFQDCTPAELEPLLPRFRRHRFQAGEPIWQQGDPAERFYVVLSGQGRNVVRNPEGDEIVTQVVGPGESFGQPALFVPDTPRIGSAISTVASEMLSLDRETLLGFLERHPAAMRRMLESMGQLILMQSNLYRGVAFHDVRGRVAYQLLKLADEYGELVAAGTRISLKLSQETLAGMVAASRESVNRALSGFVQAGALRRDGGHLVVADAAGLRRALADNGETG
jgi:CRP/FNR family cyclic AMP-dependent transcriptional regulator